MYRLLDVVSIWEKVLHPNTSHLTQSSILELCPPPSILAPPPQNPPSHPNRTHRAHQQPNASRITNPILGPKVCLVDLRPNDPHQLCARVRDTDR
jgi:hypothetical protein